MPFARSLLCPFTKCSLSKWATNSDGQIGIAIAAIRDQSPFDQAINAERLAW